MNFAVTKQCNSKCGHCSIWKTGRRTDELSLEEIGKISSSYPHLSWLSLTGGEPTDHDDLPGIAETFARNSSALYLLNFSTNGLHRRRILEQVKQILKLPIPKLLVAVSIDGPKDMHDKIRGIHGGFELASATLRDLLALAKNHRNFRAFASMTLYPENIAHSMELYASLLPLIPNLKPRDIHFNLGNGNGHLYEKKENMKFPSPPKKAFRRPAFSTPISQRFLEGSFQSMIPRFLDGGKTPIACAAIKSSFFLDERGNVFPCTTWGNTLGNVRDYDYSILEVLRSSKTTEAKMAIKDNACPQCWSPCEAYQSILASPLKSVALACLARPSI